MGSGSVCGRALADELWQAGHLDLPKMTAWMKITQTEADEILARDLVTFEKVVR